MFERDFTIAGQHASYADALTSEFNGVAVFRRLVDLLYIAPIVGLLFDRTSAPERGEGKKILTEQLVREQDRLVFAARLVILLDESSGKSPDERIRDAFAFSAGGDSDTNKLVEGRILGGIEVLYERIHGTGRRDGDTLDNFVMLLEEVESSNTGLTLDQLLDECRKVSRAN